MKNVLKIKNPETGEFEPIAAISGADGSPGANGQGVPTGGTTGQILRKTGSGDYETEWNDKAGDSERLGGLDAQYYAQGRAAHNLLVNSWFVNPVNQRGFSSTTSTGDTMCLDRWLFSVNSGGSISLTASGLVCENANLIQKIESKLLNSSKEYTQVFWLADGTPIFPTKWVEFNYSSGVGRVVYYGITGTVVAAALYEGSYTADTLPVYVPKDNELAECQRQYFPVFQSETTYAYWTKADGDTCKIYIPSPKMRVNPTPVLYDGGCTVYLAGNSIWSNAVTLQYYGYAQGCNVFSFSSPSAYFETGKTYLYRGIKALSAEM